MRRFAAVLALVAAVVPCAAYAAQQPTVATLPVDPSQPASLLRPVTLSGVFRVPRVDTALYVGTPWLVQDLTVVLVGKDGRRRQLRASTDVPGGILGVRLPADASQADRIEYEAVSVSSAAVPYVVSADALAVLASRTWPYAVAFGALALLALLCSLAGMLRRSRLCAWIAVGAATQAGLFVPWLGIVRPPPELSQPLHAALQSSSAAALALFAFALLRGVRARSIRVTAYVVWSLVAADAVTAWGGDVMQDTWPVPSVISFALAAGFDVALFALGAIGLRRRVAGARALCAGAACAMLALAASLADPTPASVVLGPTLSIVCYALAAVRALGPRATAESPAPARDAAAGLPARPIFGAPPPREATTDGLTGIPNRAAMAAALDRAWALARASHKPIALLQIDIDHFRRYNDAQGPDAGDHALCRLAAALAAALPPNAAEAMVARDGGDEFCILLPGASLDAAHGFGERIRAAVDALAIARDDVPARRLTVSIGAASLDPASVDDAFLAFARANAALYIAKAMGRDRVVVDEPVPPSELAR